ncbi:MAG: tRNA lysidine(34) synthetase TilS [Chloroflexi bacterium]|nr:tRNA lysidine(34) synthetase TilS [Chloroflexota bacterium]
MAFSGGPDSTALLIAMHRLSTEPGSESPGIEAAHFNHHLRGEGSIEDEEYCRQLCRQLGVPIHVAGADGRAHAAANGISLETAARDLRYAAFAGIVADHGFSGVATAHTTDDQAETVLLAITRGSGLRGLAGMSPVTERGDIPASPGNKPLTVFRPLLAAGITGAQTTAFCQSSDVTPRIDPSNTDETFARNRIRHSVMPGLRKINPAVTESLVTLAANAASASELLHDLAASALENVSIDEHGGFSKDRLLKADDRLRPYVMMAVYQRATGDLDGLDKAHVDAMCDLLENGLEINLPGGWRMVADHDSARVIHGDNDPSCPYPLPASEQQLAVPGSINLGHGYTLSARMVSPVPDFSTLTPWQGVLAGEVVGTGLIVRGRQDGDRFQPLGMTGEMKLQDFFVNQHLPWWWRDRIPLVIANGRIAWVTCQRIAEWARVPDRATSAVILEFTHDG